MELDPTDFRVVSAAMLMDDGLIVTGVRHYSPDMRATLKRIYGSGFKLFGRWIRKPYHLRVVEQGFIDARGNFLTRQEAWKRADRHGQIMIRSTGRYRLIALPANQGEEDKLYSENLY